jgi:hypothetical protein
LKALLRFAMAICIIAPLSVWIVLAAFSSGPWQSAIVAISFPLAAVSGVTMLKRWRTAFSIVAGSQLFLQCCGCVLGTELGYAGAWVVLGIGLACLLVGDQGIWSGRLYVGVSESGLSSRDVVSATARSFWRILFFVAVVMVCSLLVLFLILVMDIGSLPLPYLLASGLLVMVSLYYLATRGTMSGDEEKPNI